MCSLATFALGILFWEVPVQIFKVSRGNRK